VHRFRAAAPECRVALAVVVMSGLVAYGCGSGGPVMGRVSGTVTHEGKPLDHGTITFSPTDGQRPSATGAIQSGGSYTLQTAEPGDGAVVGEYKVAISDIDSNVFATDLPGAPVKVPKSSIPKKYSDPGTSSLTAKVERGSNKLDFDIKDK